MTMESKGVKQILFGIALILMGGMGNYFVRLDQAIGVPIWWYYTQQFGAIAILLVGLFFAFKGFYTKN